MAKKSPTKTETLWVPTENDWQPLLWSWVAALAPGTVVFLKGDLGFGKTSLVRAVLRLLGYQDKVKSPTYNIVESYESWPNQGQHPPVHHFDLYRIYNPEELFFLGLESYFDGQALVFVEWPEMGQGYLPEPDWILELSMDMERPEGRWLSLSQLK